MRKDLLATALTGVAVFVFAASHEGWGVPLVGSSHRWAAAAILAIGMVTCGLGSPERAGASAWPLAALGVVALALAVVTLATGSLTALSLLTAAFAALWLFSTARHLHHRAPRHPVAT